MCRCGFLWRWLCFLRFFVVAALFRNISLDDYFHVRIVQAAVTLVSCTSLSIVRYAASCPNLAQDAYLCLHEVLNQLLLGQCFQLLAHWLRELFDGANINT